MTCVILPLGQWRSVDFGTFYLGGSFPRTRHLYRNSTGALSIETRNLGGTFHDLTADIRAELAFCDAIADPDDPARLRDHHAYATALREALELIRP